MDSQLATLVSRLSEAELLHCVNLIVVSDHGMSTSGEDKVVDLAKYLPEFTQHSYLIYGAGPTLTPRNEEGEL